MMHSLTIIKNEMKSKYDFFFSKIKFENILMDDHYNIIHISKIQKYQKVSSIAI